MDDIRQTAIDRFRAYLSAGSSRRIPSRITPWICACSLPRSPCPWPRSPFARSTSLWSASITRPGLGDDQPAAQCAEALFCLLPGAAAGAGNPVAQPLCPAWHPLPKALSREQVQRLFAQIAHPMDRALFLVILRCGLRVSEVANLKLEQIDWEQQALQVVQGKGRKDRRVYMSPGCRPASNSAWSSIRASGRRAMCFGTANAPSTPLRESDPKEDGALCQGGGHHASCHSLRTFASNLLEHGAEVVAIRDFLEHSQIASASGMPNSRIRRSNRSICDHAENLEAGPCDPRERYGVHIYTTK